MRVGHLGDIKSNVTCAGAAVFPAEGRGLAFARPGVLLLWLSISLFFSLPISLSLSLSLFLSLYLSFSLSVGGDLASARAGAQRERVGEREIVYM